MSDEEIMKEWADKLSALFFAWAEGKDLLQPGIYRRCTDTEWEYVNDDSAEVQSLRFATMDDETTIFAPGVRIERLSDEAVVLTHAGLVILPERPAVS